MHQSTYVPYNLEPWAGDVVQWIESSPRLHKPWVPSPALPKPGPLIHASIIIPALGRWKQESEEFKDILSQLHSEMESRLGYMKPVSRKEKLWTEGVPSDKYSGLLSNKLNLVWGTDLFSLPALLLIVSSLLASAFPRNQSVQCIPANILNGPGLLARWVPDFIMSNKLNRLVTKANSLICWPLVNGNMDNYICTGSGRGKQVLSVPRMESLGASHMESLKLFWKDPQIACSRQETTGTPF